MGRKKVIEDGVLLQLMENYYEKECQCNAERMKLPEIADYVRRQGYPGYAVESLRRNPLARDYIDGKKQTAKDDRLVTLVYHKPIDVDAFLDAHPTRCTLRCGLVEIDNYYGVVVSTAVDAIKQHNTLKTKVNEITEALKQVQKENEVLREVIAASKKELSKLKARVRTCEDIVNDYVYTGIANELLMKDGVLSEVSTGIDPRKLEEKLITSTAVISQEEKTQFRSNILTTLTKRFEDKM